MNGVNESARLHGLIIIGSGPAGSGCSVAIDAERWLAAPT
jgi:thioredoxin reductase